MASSAVAYIHAESEEPPADVVGAHQGLRRVWTSVQMVAPTDSPVLIQGETGTGKELVARAIHMRSRRSRGPYVQLNCAAMPAGLLESELFGHERGAFTGAVSQFAGRFERAHGGTLFLDEIGDMPLELQPKLLRVLQEQEFEPLGGTRTIRVDVRVVAATNQDLLQMLRERRFRADLFYRLNVFPLALPALRERREDIPPLVEHFVRKFSERMNKTFLRVPDEAIETLKRHHWPGNVRELENFVHRAVITSPPFDLRFPLEDLVSSAQPDASGAIRTLAEAERAHIMDVLNRVGGVVGGREGAAARLGVARTTLLYRMRRLGISTGAGRPEL
ncbi:sigma 54-interacting transcriptional regulator [uncultured Paludibaculum sp.]|uniref:sigma-54 interaction domain-containing protein n=1 Tax=uncultured Paludibaculum sp. TaxID=1765020 RepID=UPI002AAC455F|nr:sigma 54-interacting transcriptional regulator [uncultured Paludibaculum sp.]